MRRNQLLTALGLVVVAGLLFVLLRAASPSAEQRLETFLDQSQATAPMREAYRFAQAHPEALKAVPCYCGCHSSGHKYNYNCFMTEDDQFDLHGIHCPMCVDIALETKRLYESGVPLKDIRHRIDLPFKDHKNLTPTPTPMPT